MRKLLLGAWLAASVAVGACQGGSSSAPAGAAARHGSSASPNTTMNPRPRGMPEVPNAVTAPDEDPCTHVGEGVRAIWDKQVADASDDATRKGAIEMRLKAVTRLERHCHDDKWSAAAAECIRGGGRCTDKLTPEQQEKLAADNLNK